MANDVLSLVYRCKATVPKKGAVINIFVLDANPRLAAQMHCDKHVGKMLSETAQILSTVVWPFLVTEFERHGWKHKSKALRQVVRELYKERTQLFLPTHDHHPCTLWAGKNRSNFDWLYQLGCGLEDEWHFRRKKGHKSGEILHRVYRYAEFLSVGKRTPFVQSFETNYPHLIDPNDPVGAYRAFYREDKASFAKYEWGRPAPEWFR